MKYIPERTKGQQQTGRPDFQPAHLYRTSIQNIQKLSNLYKRKTKHPVKSVTKIGTDASGELCVAKKIMKMTPLGIKETQTKARRYHDAPTRTTEMKKTDLLSVGEEVGGWNPPRTAVGKAKCAVTRKTVRGFSEERNSPRCAAAASLLEK